MRHKLLAALLAFIPAIASAQIDPYTYQGGNLHLRGKLTSSNPKMPLPKLTVFYLRDQILRQDMNTQVDIADDGTFETDIALPHPLFTWTRDFGDHIFFLPGDTLEIEADVATEQMEIIRSDAAKRLANIDTKENALMNGLKPGWEAGSWSVSEVQAYIDTVMTRIDDYLSANPAPEYPDTIAAHELLVCEIDRLAPVSNALSQAVMARMYFDVPDSASVKPDYSSIARVMAKHDGTLTDNPAVFLCSRNADMILNYLEYREYAPLLHIWPKKRNKRPEDDAKFDGMITSPWILPEDYDADAHEAYRYAFDNQVYNYGIAYDNSFGKIERKTGFQRDKLLSQIVLARYFAETLRDSFDVDTPACNHARASVFASVMHHFTNPTIALKIVNQFRALVRKFEGGVSAVNPIPEVLAEIIKPYKERVLYIDFWGMGCGPCRAGMLAHREIVKEMEGKPVSFLYIACEKDSPREPSEQWMSKNNINGEHIFISPEQWKALNGALNFNAIPFSIYVDPEQESWDKPKYDMREELKQRLEKSRAD